ncbi:hypothetical protein [Thalassotalea sp. PLHSN55]|uniref:hypothetical protein n=1 Tax=Thalassotalea sp. PLHSN55 TaxID=3435888 RepID=UPI003F84CFF0
MKVYQIIFEVDDYQSLLAKDDEVHKIKLMAMGGDSRIDMWPTVLEAELDNKRGLRPDIYSVNAGNMLVKPQTLELLKAHLSTRDELLPVSWEGEAGVLINPVGTYECLNHDETIWEVDDSDDKLWIEKYVFNTNKVPHTLLFRVEEDWFTLFCVDLEDGSVNFKSIVENHNLKGISFLQV